MRIKSMALCGLLLAPMLAWGQAVSGSTDGGGGATTLAELTDVDETARTEDDILKVNAGGDYVNVNLLAAIAADAAATVLDLDGGFEVADFRCTASAGVLTCLDPTATTGDTSFIVKAGAGQSSNLISLTNNGGSLTAGLTIDDLFGASAVRTSNHLYTGSIFGMGISGNVSFLIENQVQDKVIQNADGQFGFSSSSAAAEATFRTNFDTGIARSAAGIIRVTDGSTGLGYLQAGAFDLDDGGTQPTCDSSTRGYFWMDEGGAGVADSVDVCAKDSGDAYAWRTIY